MRHNLSLTSHCTRYSALGDAVRKPLDFLSGDPVQDCLFLSFVYILQCEIFHMRSHNLLQVAIRPKLARVEIQAHSKVQVLPTAAGVFKPDIT
jgi:hypothetical protein